MGRGFPKRSFDSLYKTGDYRRLVFSSGSGTANDVFFFLSVPFLFTVRVCARARVYVCACVWKQ